jgi:hypothetical protein
MTKNGLCIYVILTTASRDEPSRAEIARSLIKAGTYVRTERRQKSMNTMQAFRRPVQQ